MKRIKLLTPILGITSIATITMPLASCGSSEVKVTGVTLSDSDLSLGVGATITLTPTITPSNATNQTLKWTSSNTSVATVSDGTITGVAEGTTTITATTTDGSNKSASCSVTVVFIGIEEIRLTVPTYLSVNHSVEITATILPTDATNKTLKWTSSDTSVATIDESTGVATGVAAGTTTITATATDGTGIYAKETLEVREIPLTGITLSPSSTTIAKGNTVTLTPTYTPSDASNQSIGTWSSSSPSVATVSNGVVTAIAEGTTTITATSSTGDVAGSATITVVASAESEKTISSSGTYTGAYSSTTAEKNSVLINAGSSTNVTIQNSSISKSGDSDGGDDDSFYGYNSALLAKGGVKVTLNNVSVNSTAKGGNGIFCYGGKKSNEANASGDGTTITATGCTVTTTKDNAGGFMTTGDGISYLNNCTATTAGGSSAPLRTDRGGGTVTVTNGTYTSNGQGSPAIYSTAAISCTGTTLVSNHSEGVVIEGGNSVSLTNCSLTDTNDTLNGKSTTYKNIFLYQSMSGDASSGSSTFTAKGGSITTNYGDDFYCTNITTTINLNGCTMKNNCSIDHYFLRAEDNNVGWGTETQNGAKVTLNATDQTMVGDIYVDNYSTLAMTMSGTSTYTGTINAEKSTKGCSLVLGSNCTLNIVNDSYVTSFSGSADNVVLKGSGHLYQYSSGSWVKVK